MNRKTNEKWNEFMVYYHGTIKHKLYEMVMFALGAFSAMVSKEALLIVFATAFIIPAFFKKSWFF